MSFNNMKCAMCGRVIGMDMRKAGIWNRCFCICKKCCRININHKDKIRAINHYIYTLTNSKLFEEYIKKVMCRK